MSVHTSSDSDSSDGFIDLSDDVFDEIATTKSVSAKSVSTNQSSSKSSVQQPINTLKFRNYQIKDKTLQALVSSQQQQKTKKKDDQLLTPELVEKFQNFQQFDDDEVLNIAPKKVTLDLQKEIAGKLDILEKQTQKAILELLQKQIETK